MIGWRFVVTVTLFTIFTSSASIAVTKNDPRTIRNTLFKYSMLLNKNHDRLYYAILKNIDFRAIGSNKPILALCSIKCGTTSSKFNREMFLKSVAAVIYCVNKIIMEHREFVQSVKSKNCHLSSKEKRHFEMICSFYQSKNVDELLERISPVPVSLAVAQAALESGFGSHKHMRNKNAFFGMMHTNNQLIQFDTVFEAAIAYTKTLNVSSCYKKFRKERKLMMCKSHKIDGHILLEHIGQYYTDKQYKRHITSIIKEYNLTSLDAAYI